MKGFYTCHLEQSPAERGEVRDLGAFAPYNIIRSTKSDLASLDFSLPAYRQAGARNDNIVYKVNYKYENSLSLR